MDKAIKTLAIVGGGILGIHLLQKKGVLGQENLKQGGDITESEFAENVTSEAKEQREIQIEKNDSPSAEFLGGYSAISSTYSAIPSTSKVAYKSGYEIETIGRNFDKIDSRYGNIFAEVSNITRITPLILKGFAMIESGGDPNAGNSCCVGFMALHTSFAGAIIFNENKLGRLTNSEKSYLSKHLGSSRLNAQLRSGRNVLTKTEIRKPEVNVMLGALKLGQLMDKYTTNGKIKWEFVIAEYNWNYQKAEKLFRTYKTSSTDTILAKAPMPNETKKYIVKFLGKNGVLDIQLG